MRGQTCLLFIVAAWVGFWGVARHVRVLDLKLQLQQQRRETIREHNAAVFANVANDNAREMLRAMERMTRRERWEQIRTDEEAAAEDAMRLQDTLDAILNRPAR